jgi:hypothetical protein
MIGYASLANSKRGPSRSSEWRVQSPLKTKVPKWRVRLSVGCDLCPLSTTRGRNGLRLLSG